MLKRLPEGDRASRQAMHPIAPHRDPSGYFWAVAAVAIAAGVAFLCNGLLPVASFSLFFLVAVLLIATRFGPWPSFFAALLSALVYNYFFTEPYFSLLVSDTGVVLTLLLFLIVAVLMGNAAARLRANVEAERAIGLERARAGAEMEESRIVAERERLRSALLSSVSHDLRTPLVSIIGAATSLLEEPNLIGVANRRQLLETVRDEGERLNRYVQNLLDMTRISNGALEVRQEWFDMREVVGAALRQLRAELRHVKVHVDIPADLPSLRGDALLLEQALVNVLHNASRYAPAASQVGISARATPGDMIEMAVTDRGPGIPEADRERVFDMFYRVRSGDSSGSGTGLGLAIARGILAAHGGTIRATANPDGVGTRVVLALPLPAAGEREPR